MKEDNFRTGAASVMVIVSLAAHSVLPSEGILPCSSPATEMCEQQPLTLSDDPAPKPEPQFLRELAVTISSASTSNGYDLVSLRKP